MPRFFFDVRDGCLTPDLEGLELDGVDSAREQALETLGDLVKFDMIESETREFTVTVRDVSNALIVVATASLKCRVL